MPHIQFAEGLPGITGPMAFSPQTAKPLNDLAEVLLRGNASDSLTQGERELIAAYVSKRNECLFCSICHGTVADYVLGPEKQTVAQTWDDPTTAPISDKLKTLLSLADSVRQGGQCVSPDQITMARQQGATDRDIHDTVLIAAAFSMFNRYVDGLATWAPADPAAYGPMGAMLATQGYAAQTPSGQPASV